MSHSRSRGKRSQPQHHQQINKGGWNPSSWQEERSESGFESGGPIRYPGEQSEYQGQRDYGRFGRGQEGSGHASGREHWDDEEKGRQFGSSWRSGNTQRESGNRDWVSGVGQSDYRENGERFYSPAGDPSGSNSMHASRGTPRSMGTWGSEGGGGWSTGSQSRKPSFAGRGPQGYRRSDERITEDVNEELTRDDEIDASGISVEVKDGEVILKGFVTDRESKRRAEVIAESCSGVKDVQNQIRIKREDSTGSDQEARHAEANEKSENKRTRLAS